VPSNVCIPYFDTSDISFHADNPVTGKTFVAPSADRTGGPGLSTDTENLFKMSPCAAGAKASGVAVYDVADEKIGHMIGTPGRIVPVTAGGTINAGQEVEVGAGGKAIAKATGISVGQALSGGTNNNDVAVKLY
jgi:hypothetical protein